MKRFCPKCGATITKGVFCENCAVKELKYKQVVVQISEFQRTFHKGRWIMFKDVNDVIVSRVQEELGKKIPVTIEPFSFEPRPKNKIIVNAHISFEGQDVTLPVTLSYMQCDFGQKEKTQYYEGILQIRNSSDNLLVFVQQELKKVAKKGIFITKMQKTKDGVDLYITNKSYIRLLAQKIHAKFGGDIKINPQLFSHNHLTSKDIFRLNVLVKLPSFQVGDIISYIPLGVRKKEEEKIVLVKRLGKIMQATDLFSGKNITFEFKFAKNIKNIKKFSTQIIATTPSLLVLDPETFQATLVSNQAAQKISFEPDEKVIVVKSKQGLLLVKKA